MKKKIILIIGILVICIALTSCKNNTEITEEWKESVVISYNDFISEVKNNPSIIPMIITTDQHGSITSDSEIFSYINEITDWDNVSKIINLGDTVKLIYSKKQLNDYKNATSILPEEKRIEIIGNHDRILCFNKEKVKDTFFETINAVYNDEKNAFVVEDDIFNVRYLSMDPETYPWSYKSGKLTTSQADFIVSELEKDDDSDIIFLSHPYLFNDNIVSRDNESFTGSDFFIGSDSKYSDVKESFTNMLSKRKEKGSGILIDCYGNKHPYDFSGCNSDLLMTLHGHHHSEGYETKDGVTEFLFQGMNKDNKDNSEPNCIYFAYIDREKEIFKCFKIVEGKKYDAWSVSIS